MAWLYVVGAAFLDIGIFTLLRVYGFMRSWHTVLVIAMAIALLFIMQFALKGLPMGTAYAAFASLATVGTVVVGILFFHDPVSFLRLFFVGMIVAGVVGLKLIENPA